MEFNNEEFLKDRDNQSKQEGDKPNAWRVEDDDNLKQEDLEKSLTGDDNTKPVMESTGTGGGNFGQNNNTPAANDANNPSQYSGNSNAYFDRTEPSEEHPENSNFKDHNQDGAPDYASAQPTSGINNEGDPKPEKVERGNGENDRPHKGNTYQEGTADNDEPNIPGPNEVPDQQKVGEDMDDDKDHIET
jgi:hypothetical protein